ncbi:MAG: hypothetical protein AAGC55_31780 [Myxococcota bacterium]
MKTKPRANAPVKNDHVRQWVALKKLYIKERGSDAGPNKKAIPRTTNDDVEQLSKYWHGEYLRELIKRPLVLDKDLASRRRWLESKRTIDRQLAQADPKARYPANAWFWDDATAKLSIYLESRKAVPSPAKLLVEAVSETVTEKVTAAKDAVNETTKGIGSLFKTGLLVLGGLAGARWVVPPLIEAVRREPDKRR